MFWIIFIMFIGGYFAYTFNKDRDEMLNAQVDSHGGMAKKYDFLVCKLTGDVNAKVIKVTRDHIHIRYENLGTTMNFLIDELPNQVQIEWIANVGIYGKHTNKWIFEHSYPQANMIVEIEKFMDWKFKQITSQ